MSKQKLLLIVTFLTVLGGFLRFYQNTKNPVSLNIDEVSFGYNAYSILKTARDEYGTFLPITFKSVGDYKNPVPIYSMVPSIAIFGLNEFGVRFPTTLIATLSIPLFYLFFYSLIGSVSISLIATILLAISPWHIFYSRYVSDHLIATSLVVLGVLLFQMMIKKGWGFAVGSATALILSMYTYYPERVFTPLLILTLLVLNLRKLLANKFKISIFLITAAVLVAPLAFLTFFGPDKARADMVFITKDIDYTRYVLLDQLNKPQSPISYLSNDKFLLIFYWIRKYLNYLEPSFLFYNGLNMTNAGSFGLGVMYLFEVISLPLGVLYLIKNKYNNRILIFLWILIGLIPASLTNNEQSAGRSLLILPVLLIISAVGIINFFRLIKKITFRSVRIGIYFFIGVLVGWNLIQAYLVFAIHFPMERGEAFMEGTKQSVEYALANKDKYREIVFDPYRGIIAPDIVNIPHMYILFYSKYDPLTYQTEKKRQGNELYGFDKFTIRRIDWRVDRLRKDTLFIGSPWSLPKKDIKQQEILKRIYLSNGNFALLVVSPR